MSSPAPRDSEHHARVGALFAAVCDLATGERAAHLAAACADDPLLLCDVEELLEFEARDADFLEGRAPLRLPAEAAPEPGPGEQLGDYRLVRLIGTGGMGRVFEAEQRAPHRLVALKLLTSEFATPGVLKRFEREGEVLARLKHPSIAQIYSVETVTAQGALRPFFTMELVEGPPITEYADAHDLGWRERLQLVSAVCDAAEHAHQRGVIHRDLKPANILVAADGVPKVLDFGVARLTDADLSGATLDTHVGQIIGTLAAMSPEQASGDPNEIDTRSDVYSLGVLLYELLTGRLPYDLDGKSLPEALRTIQEHEPARLRRATDTSTGMFDADVATVVAKALEKDKERRYSSAHALGEDLRRVLRSEPIVARPATTLYQLKKFAQRNRILVISGVLVFLVVSIGFATSSVMYVKAENARGDTELALARALDAEREASASAEQARNAEALARAAEAQAREEAVAASRTADLMINIFDLNLPEQARGETITAREILDGASERLAVELRDQPRIRARLSNALGQVYLNLGLYDSSRAHYEEALELREAEYGPTAEPTLETVGDLAVVLWRLGEYEQAKAYHLRAIAGLELLLGPDDTEIANRLNSLGALLGGIGDWDGAFEAFTRAVEIRDRNPDSDPLETAQIAHNLGIVQGRLGRPEEAEQTLRRVLEVRREFGGENDPELALVLGSLANLLADSGDLEAAVELYVEALAISEKVHGPEHPTVSSDLGNLATGLIQLGRFDEAGPLLERALGITERAVGTREHRRYAMQLLNLATVRAGQGDPATALDMNAEARATFVAKLGPDHPYVAECDRVRPYWEAELAELEREGHSAP